MKKYKDPIATISNWRHSGFRVSCGERIFPQNENAMENLARHNIRASFSQERMQYLAEPSKVVYWAKDGTGEKAAKYALQIGGPQNGVTPKLIPKLLPRANGLNLHTSKA